jgi:hypothetical protein
VTGPAFIPGAGPVEFNITEIGKKMQETGKLLGVLKVSRNRYVAL